MIVDIGGGTAEVAVISLSDIVQSSSLRVAGDEMNDAITKHMKEVYNLQIGEQTAERVKIEIGSAYMLEEELTKEVRGMDTLAGLPRTVNIRSEEIREALSGPLSQIVKTIKLTLEGTPPELAADLIESGITLAGGGALLRGLDKMLARETGLPVRRAEDPLTAVARGTGVVLDQIETLWPVLEDGRECA
jgi:rod shape-determining protein MreB and related proteins